MQSVDYDRDDLVDRLADLQGPENSSVGPLG
jgi:hypothetical protein